MPNRLLRRRWRKPDDPVSVTPARKIVEAYGKLLECCHDAIGIRDASELPYSKQEIKRALCVVLRETGHPLLRSTLRRSYVLLAHWQEGYTQPQTSPAAIETGDDPGATTNSCTDDETDDWFALVESERVKLRRELQRL